MSTDLPFGAVNDEKGERNPFDPDDEPDLQEAWVNGWNAAPEFADQHFQISDDEVGEAFGKGITARIVAAMYADE